MCTFIYAVLFMIEMMNFPKFTKTYSIYLSFFIIEYKLIDNYNRLASINSGIINIFKQRMVRLYNTRSVSVAEQMLTSRRDRPAVDQDYDIYKRQFQHSPSFPKYKSDVAWCLVHRRPILR